MPGAKSAVPKVSRTHWLLLSAPWLLYLIYPIGEFMGRSSSTAALDVLAVGLLLAFLAVYLYLWHDPFELAEGVRAAGVVSLVALSVAAFATLSLPGALAGIIYAGSSAAYFRSSRYVYGLAGLVVLVVVGAWRLDRLPSGIMFEVLLPFFGLLIALRGYGQLWQMGMRLRAAEGEVRELAVQNERLAMSRDLHDLIGHSLSVLALRADLAAQQAEARAPDAADEMRQVAELARQALHDTREVVSRWRSLTYAGEWDHARTVLEAAGLDTRGEAQHADLPPELDRAFGFLVREACTNVLRHSNASRVSLTQVTSAGKVRVTVADDGTRRPSGPTGSGIQGLRERFAALGGSVWEVPGPDGFTLTAEVPMPDRAAEGTGT